MYKDKCFSPKSLTYIILVAWLSTGETHGFPYTPHDALGFFNTNEPY